MSQPLYVTRSRSSSYSFLTMPLRLHCLSTKFVMHSLVFMKQNSQQSLCYEYLLSVPPLIVWSIKVWLHVFRDGATCCVGGIHIDLWLQELFCIDRHAVLQCTPCLYNCLLCPVDLAELYPSQHDSSANVIKWRSIVSLSVSLSLCRSNK